MSRHPDAPSADPDVGLRSEVASVRPGQELDWASLTSFLQSKLTGLEGDISILQFPRGWANLTYLVRFGEHQLVVRRPPFGTLAPGAHDMGREYRTLSRLWRHFDRAPRALLLCDDHSVIGSDFVVMEYREGVVVDGDIPASMAGHADVSRRIGMAVIDALAELHRLDPAACDLADLGRPEGFVERQMTGWRRRWRLAAPDGAVPLMEAAGDKLEASMPHSPRPSVLHNDFKLDNCQFDPAVPDRVKSIFDWDMATLGDPLVDLGTLLNYWPDPSDTDGNRPIVTAGMETMGLPGRAEMIDRYAAQTGLDVTEAHWYEAFACWKRAVIMQQLYARYLQGDSTDDRMAAQGEWIPALAERALAILGG